MKTAKPMGPQAGVNGWVDVLLEVEEPLAGLGGRLKGVAEGVLAGREIREEQAYLLAGAMPWELPSLCRVASIIRERGQGQVVTFSPKVFIPLTRLCRDLCGYCTFRQEPEEAHRLYMSPEEILAVASAGERLGCTEALFTLGERPEQRYPQAREWLSSRGYATTIDYLTDACRLVLSHTSLLPHPNPGTLSHREMARLKEVSASVGIMVESVSQRLCRPGGPHELAPSKRPRARLKTVETAGELRVPFTTGILVGIGETREERVESILAIDQLHRRYGHVQEVIVQNFRAKPHTLMAGRRDAATEEMLWSVAMSRILLGPRANLQVPPNLSYDDYPLFLLAGSNDWGGVSPLTIDYVNPEAPWPQLGELRRRTEELGFSLWPRLPVYPEYVVGDDYLAPSLKGRIKSLADENGYAKGGVQRYASTNA